MLDGGDTPGGGRRRRRRKIWEVVISRRRGRRCLQQSLLLLLPRMLRWLRRRRRRRRSRGGRCWCSCRAGRLAGIVIVKGHRRGWRWRGRRGRLRRHLPLVLVSMRWRCRRRRRRLVALPQRPLVGVVCRWRPHGLGHQRWLLRRRWSQGGGAAVLDCRCGGGSFRGCCNWFGSYCRRNSPSKLSRGGSGACHVRW